MSSELHTRLTTSAPATNSTVAAAAIRTEPQAIQPAPAVTPETVAHPNPAANSAGVLAEHLSESNVSTHLSSLLKRQVSFKLRITPNKELALIDVAMIFNGLDNDQAGLAVRRLLEQFPDVRSNRSNFKFPGRGRQTVDVAPLAEALEFAFLLPGRNAAKVRKEAAKLLVRYLGGDLSLVDEIFLRNHVQAALARIPEEERTAEQQTARLFGESVESTQPAPLIFHLPPPPIIMESCPTGCLDDGPPHFYILRIPSQPGAPEDGDTYRGGRTKDFDARMLKHHAKYGEGSYMALRAPNYGHMETLWHRRMRMNAITQGPREERILASNMEISEAPKFIMELHSRRQTELQLENLPQTASKKRTREEAEDERVIAVIDAKRDLAVAELGAKRDLAVAELGAKREFAVAELGAKREFARDREQLFTDRERLMLRLAAEGNADAIKALFAPKP